MALLYTGEAHLAHDVTIQMAPATGPPVKDRVVLNPLKVAVHHGARFAAWKATMLIGVGNAMIGTSMTPRRTLQKPSTFQALCLGMKLRIGSWTQGLQPI